MTAVPPPHVVSSYLAQLESALRGLEPSVRNEIVTGILEELDGLGALEAAARVEILGDPEFIAAEARAATLAPLPSTASTIQRHSNTLPIIVAFIVMLGGLVIPLVGGLVGLALVGVSRAWTRTEKAIALLIPAAGIACATIVGIVTTVIARDQTRFEGPSMPPLQPDRWYVALLAVLALFAIDGVWLLSRVLRRR